MTYGSRAPEGYGEQLLAASPVHEGGGHDGHQHIHYLHSHTGQRRICDACLHAALSLVIERHPPKYPESFHVILQHLHAKAC